MAASVCTGLARIGEEQGAFAGSSLLGSRSQKGRPVALGSFPGAHAPSAPRFGPFPTGLATVKALKEPVSLLLVRLPAEVPRGPSSTCLGQWRERRPQCECGDLLETNYWGGSASKTHHFPKGFPRTALTFGATFDNHTSVSQLFKFTAKKTSDLTRGPGNWPRRTVWGSVMPPDPPCPARPHTTTRYLLERICISFSEMCLSLGLNRLSGKDGERVNFGRGGCHTRLENHCGISSTYSVPDPSSRPLPVTDSAGLSRRSHVTEISTQFPTTVGVRHKVGV